MCVTNGVHIVTSLMASQNAGGLYGSHTSHSLRGSKIALKNEVSLPLVAFLLQTQIHWRDSPSPLFPSPDFISFAVAGTALLLAAGGGMNALMISYAYQ